MVCTERKILWTLHFSPGFFHQVRIQWNTISGHLKSTWETRGRPKFFSSCADDFREKILLDMMYPCVVLLKSLQIYVEAQIPPASPRSVPSGIVPTSSLCWCHRCVKSSATCCWPRWAGHFPLVLDWVYQWSRQYMNMSSWWNIVYRYLWPACH